jgi:hypothetical protein
MEILQKFGRAKGWLQKRSDERCVMKRRPIKKSGNVKSAD